MQTTFEYNRNGDDVDYCDLLTDVSGDETLTLSWDDNGNMTEGKTANYDFYYNWDNKLRRVMSGSTAVVQLKYDPDGNRIWKKSSVNGERDYIVDTVGDLPVILMELNGSTVDKTYIYANGQILAQHTGDHTASRYFFLHDRLGSVRLVIDTSGSVKNRYTYKPFGEVYPAPDFEETVPACGSFRFTGQYFDSEIDQYYLRARQYYPHIARFTSRDPLTGKFEEPLTLHRYLYCRNNPINRIDPAGLQDWVHHETEETESIIAAATELVGTHWIRGPLLAFGWPGHTGRYDYFGLDNYTFQLDKAFMTNTEFGNYLAGYTCYYNYGFRGELGVRGAGHGFALWQHHRIDEPASRYFISAGILSAQGERQHAGIGLEPAGRLTFVRAKHELFYGYEWMIDELLATGGMGSPAFDQQLINWTQFWNSGRFFR